MYSKHFWLAIAAATLRKKKPITVVAFKTYFKLSPSLADLIYSQLVDAGYEIRIRHYLWTLHYLRSTDPRDTQIAFFLHTQRRNLHDKVYGVMDCICKALPELDFESRFSRWNYLDPSCLVDSKFVRIGTPYLNPWHYYSIHKASHGILYQVVVSLGKPYRILSFDGPFKGAAADVSIYRCTIKPKLRVDEKVMADKGYLADSTCITPPKGTFASLDAKGKAEFLNVTKIRQLNERVIGRLNQWGCFSKKWNQSIKLHSVCALTCAKLTQLELYLYPLT